MSCIYEVNCFLQKDAVDEFLTFLDSHARELLALEGFKSADIYIPEEDINCPADAKVVTAVYKLDSREALQNYFDNHAPRLKADTMRLFEGRIKGATRRIMSLNKSFTS